MSEKSPVTEEALKRAMMACFSDSGIRQSLRDIFKEEFESRDREIKQLKEQVSEQKKIIEAQAETIDDIEQYSRRNCLNFNGVAETANEKPTRVAVDLGRMLGVQLQPSDIDRAHRIGKPQTAQDGSSRTRTLIVKFVSYTKRDEVWRARKQLRTALPPRQSCLPPNSTKNAFVTENLTKRNQKVMYLARQLRREGKIWAAWSDDCVMKIKTADGAATQKIKTEDDLRRIVERAETAGRRSSVATAPIRDREPEQAGPARPAGSSSFAAAAAAPAEAQK